MTSIDTFHTLPHLSREIWQQVNLQLIAKSIAELLHEQVLQPEITGKEYDERTHFRLNTDQENHYYTFTASPRMLDYWHVYPGSIQKHEDGRLVDTISATAFFVEQQVSLGLKPFTLARYIEEVQHTLYADAYLCFRGRMAASQLAAAGYQETEHRMDGHPWVIVNKSRIGFDVNDYNRYAPEADQTIHLLWIAVHRSRAVFSSLGEIEETNFLQQELGEEVVDAFRQKLTAKGLNPDNYILMPVHEWQWHNKLLMQFAGDIAHQLLIPLGIGKDIYSPQQSIRTFYNVSHPEKHYVKMAVSILSTGNIRGLSPRQMLIAPRITKWVKDMLDNDPKLKKMGLILLGEVATVTYQHPGYHAITNAPYQFNEMLGVLWRESAASYLQAGEKMITMASLLYVDDQGNSLAGALVAQSGLTTAAWLRAYLTAYLTPLLQIYYQHSLCVTPHGENIILVMRDQVPVRIIIKDFVDDIVLTTEAKEKLPPELASGLIQSSNKENIPLFILLGVFDAFFRYLADVFHTYGQFEEHAFWKLVAEVVVSYQSEHPELADRFRKYDLFTPSFKRFYINSLRLLHHGYEDRTDFAIPPKGGVLVNPLVQVTEVALNVAP
ncbi:IucA/IucC family protein [Chitinophaga sp. 30R24]|uniref:IucA/IucC family protein n=1 Tax=Chitinophaga sp. 30R24 TaxID=3248838 RepID=UPI003B91956C